MAEQLGDLAAFLAVARSGGFREAARGSGGTSSASGLSEAVRRLEARLGVRLLTRTTRSVSLSGGSLNQPRQAATTCGLISTAVVSMRNFL